MVEFLLTLPNLAGASILMAFTTLFGLLVYVVSYQFISKYKSDDLTDPASILFRVVGVLVSLMLSLAFAEVLLKSRAIENAIDREAAAISDTFFDLQRFDTETTRDIRTVLIEYTQAVIEDDWAALAHHQLGQRAEALKKQLTERAMNLKPATPLQEKLWSRILIDIDDIADYRLIRLGSALSEPPVFVYVVVIGFLITMACLGAFRPQGPLLALVSLYAVLIGFVLYLVLALSDPYQGAFKIEPTVFERLVERLRADNA